MSKVEEYDLIYSFIGRYLDGSPDKDWHALMPVVEKIESIYDDHHGYFGVFISSNSCTIQGTNMWKYQQDPEYGTVYMINIVLETKLQSTYEAVVSFIKWYNSK